jgi:hypothetical protein
LIKKSVLENGEIFWSMKVSVKKRGKVFVKGLGVSVKYLNKSNREKECDIIKTYKFTFLS